MSARAHGAPSEQDGAILRGIYASPPSTLAKGNGVNPISLDGERVFNAVIRLGNKDRIMSLEETTLQEKSGRFPSFNVTQKEVADHLVQEAQHLGGASRD